MFFELVFVVGVLIFLMIGVFFGDKLVGVVMGLFVLLLIVVGVFVVIKGVDGIVYVGVYCFDVFVCFMKVLVFVGVVVVFIFLIGNCCVELD